MVRSFLTLVWIALVLLVASGVHAASLDTGDLVVSDALEGTLLRVSPDGSSDEVIWFGEVLVDAPVGLGVDNASGRVAVALADFNGGVPDVIEVDPLEGTARSPCDGTFPGDPTDVAYEDNGNLVVAINPMDSSGIAALQRCDATTRAQSTISSGGLMEGPFAVTIGPGGDLLVTDAAKVVRIDAVSGMQTLVSSGQFFEAPAGIAYRDDCGLFVSDFGSPGGTGRILEVNLQTGEQTSVSNAGLLIDPFGIALEEDCGIVVVNIDLQAEVSNLVNEIVRINPSGGGQSVVRSFRGFHLLFDVEVVPEPTAGSLRFAALVTVATLAMGRKRSWKLDGIEP